MLGLIKRTCDFTNNSMQRRALYLSLVRSQFEHCSIIWRPHTITLENKIEALQKRSIKLILFECFSTYTQKEYLVKMGKLDLLPLAIKLTYSDLLLFHRIIHKDVCINLPYYIQLASFPTTNCNMNTRTFVASTESFDHLKFISTEKPKIAAFEKSFFYRTISKWNNLPLAIRIVNGYDRFKILLKKHLWNIVMERPD